MLLDISSVTQLSPTLCDPMDCSTSGFRVHHQLPDVGNLSSVKLLSIESVMSSNNLILCLLLLLLSSIFPNIRVFSNESATSGGQNTGVSALTSVLPMKTQDRFPLGWTSWISLQSKGLQRVFSNTTVQKYQFFNTQLSSQSNIHT